MSVLITCTLISVKYNDKNSSTTSDDVFKGLVDNDIHKTYTHLLTGYVGNDLFLRELSVVVKTLREHNPDIVYRGSPSDYYYYPLACVHSTPLLSCCSL